MRRLFLLLPFLILAAPIAAAGQLTGKVADVNESDPIIVLSAGQRVKVRLADIGCPEKGQPYSRQARQYTSDAAFGITVTVQGKGRERYGRSVAGVVLFSGNLLNRDLATAGLAWQYRQYAPKNG